MSGWLGTTLCPTWKCPHDQSREWSCRPQDPADLTLCHFPAAELMITRTTCDLILIYVIYDMYMICRMSGLILIRPWFLPSVTVKDVKALLPQINYRVPNMRFLKDKLQVRTRASPQPEPCRAGSDPVLLSVCRKWRPGAS